MKARPTCGWAKFVLGGISLLLATAEALPAQTYKEVHGFDYTDGQSPAGLVQATDGNLYGTTSKGGANASGTGTIFKITPSGKLTTLYSFCSKALCADGSYPVGTLIQATDGNLYGTTTNGGAGGQGTVFKFTLSGKLTTLYSFCATGYPVCPNGYWPYAGLVQGTDGNFYGTTIAGGILNYGTVFKITPSGVHTTIHNFDSSDGSDPIAALVQASDGNFYGVTQDGGSISGGTIFRIRPTGTLSTVYSFGSAGDCSDGTDPQAALIQGADGNLYGTTNGDGGCSSGTVFKVTLGGEFTTLYDFCSLAGCADGAEPTSPLVQDVSGNLYGTTVGGGSALLGTIFELDSAGALTTLYDFCPTGHGCLQGDGPHELIQDTNGTFYGSTPSGGIPFSCDSLGCGVLFSEATGLGAFVKTIPVAGKVGATVAILGTNLTGASSVTFNGTPATFRVESGSAIKAAVPAGATTGIVQVVTPGGTLSTIVAFQVNP